MKNYGCNSNNQIIRYFAESSNVFILGEFAIKIMEGEHKQDNFWFMSWWTWSDLKWVRFKIYWFITIKKQRDTM